MNYRNGVIDSVLAAISDTPLTGRDGRPAADRPVRATGRPPSGQAARKLTSIAVGLISAR